MAKTDLTLGEIDAICVQFEEEWVPGNTPGDLSMFAASHALPGTDSFLELFLEIAQIDMEHRWRDWSNQVGLAYRNDPASFTWVKAPIPGWTQYAEVLPADQQSETVRSTLGTSELRNRSRFGDAPAPEQYGIPAKDLGRFLKLMPVVAFRQGPETLLQAHFWTRLHIGRQSQNEPDPVVLLQQPKQKLICTLLADNTISRNQVLVEVLAGRLAFVHNTSSNRHFSLDNGIPVAPDQKQLVEFPFSISFENRVLGFQRPLVE